MAFSPQPKDAQLLLDTFAGLCTQMAPCDVPEGASPDCQDVVFNPGSVSSRPGLARVFQTPFPAGGTDDLVPTVVWGKSFVTPTGETENLYLDSNGVLWWENLTAAPGSYQRLGAVPAGSWAKSVTAFGREYLAISDGLQGSEVPLQWDGTNLDRVTQDGPGAPPTVASIGLPSVAMAEIAPASSLVLTEADPAGQVADGSFTRINAWTSSLVAGLYVGQLVAVAGYTGDAAAMNGSWPILAIYPGSGPTGSLIVLQAYLPAGTVYSVEAATGGLGGGTLIRSGNVVRAKTAAAHNLKVGYQVRVSGVAATAVGGGIKTITISNEDEPGVATVETNSAHGLLPGNFATVNGIIAKQIGSITSISRQGGVVTVICGAPHKLAIGASVTIDTVSDTSFNSSFIVQQIVSPTAFVYMQSDADALITDGSGHVQLNWPLPATSAPSYFEVLACPTPTTFQIAINYSNGTWDTGAVSFAWTGTFYVESVPSATEFTYKQYGPDANTADVGTVTPWGQAAPGKHQVQVHFLTRNGAVTKPSPPATFVANGGQFISVSDIPIGPPNVVGRILSFTGAEGAYYFYIPVPAKVNGQQVSTATQIDDNTTTSALLDFSDNTLYASLGVSIPGNDLASQMILDGALGFGSYGSRLITWGQRNRIQNLLNMGFDGGALASGPEEGKPLGWKLEAAGGSLVTDHYGKAWQITTTGAAAGKLSQSLYQDCYGAPIAQARTKYRLRVWCKAATPSANFSFHATISSVTASFSAAAVISGALMSADGGWVEADFTLKTPDAIPADLKLRIWGASDTAGPFVFTVDDLSLIYADNPYLDRVLFGSYVNNPEGFDGLSGKFGPSQDTRKVMDLGTIRNTLYFLTQDPGGRLHQTNDNGVTEPQGWTISLAGANCGALSAFALTKSQADDSSASGGEEWLAWASASGARVFGGDQPWKISQEIQPDWNSINPGARLSVWALNDSVERVIYFGMPMNSAGTPNLVYPVSYKGLDTAYQIASAAAPGSDDSRKWTRWNMTMNGAALMRRENNTLVPVFFGGNGAALGAKFGTGNVYVLSTCDLEDEDYGPNYPYYTTYFFSGAESLGAHRKMLAYLAFFADGSGYLTVTTLIDGLYNPWPIAAKRALATYPTFDHEIPGASASGNRMAFKFAWSAT